MELFSCAPYTRMLGKAKITSGRQGEFSFTLLGFGAKGQDVITLPNWCYNVFRTLVFSCTLLLLAVEN